MDCLVVLDLWTWLNPGMEPKVLSPMRKSKETLTNPTGTTTEEEAIREPSLKNAGQHMQGNRERTGEHAA